MELIETGGYGSVYRRTKLGHKVAVKRMSLNKDCLFFAAFKEVNSLMVLNHPNIVKSKSVNVINYKSKRKSPLSDHLIEVEMELWDTDLQTFMSKNTRGLSMKAALTLFSQVLSAVKYLHENNILHLDLKPANILLDKDGSRLCLCDFGCSSYYSFDGVANVGTINCRPPENFIYLAKGKLLEDLQKICGPGNIYSSSTDIFSCGVLLLFLLTGKNLLYPENNYRNMEIPEKHLAEFVKFHSVYIESFLLPTKEHLKDSFQLIMNLLVKMLAINPTDRPSLNDIISCSIFDNYQHYIKTSSKLRSPLYTQILTDNLDIVNFHSLLKHAFNYFEESLCSYSIVKTTLDVAIRYFVFNKTFDSVDLVACLRIAFIFFDDDEDLPLNMFNKKYKAAEVDMRCLSIMKDISGYFVRRNPFDQCENVKQLDNLFISFLRIKDYFFWRPKDYSDSVKIPNTWIDIVCKSSVISKFLLR